MLSLGDRYPADYQSKQGVMKQKVLQAGWMLLSDAQTSIRVLGIEL